ncbi:MAG TPA: DUF695 domain-containing protein [Hyphomonadaceae bacterium]|nr:DUF695 domain-containing protein [Hyphomonadaceae bacterium]HPN05909.1 DUF695 domain-containing protein [Hyphomonadaceae bacterium]
MSDDWDFYLLRVDDQPASIFVDLGIAGDAPIHTHPQLGYLRLVMRQPRPDGLSSQDEYEALMAIEDQVIPQIVEAASAIFVGRNTTAGNRDFLFYVADVPAFETAATSAMKLFPAYTFEVGSREDADWAVYRDFLYPAPDDMQRIQNRRVVINLEQNGDNPTQPREIDHWVDAPDRTKQQAIITHILSEGFALINAATTPDEQGYYSINFKRADIPANIDDVTLPLIHRITDLGGDYDGWGCTIQS